MKPDYYVLRTEGMGKYHWFSGTVDQYERRSIVLTDVIFTAHEFDTEEAAKNAAEDIGGVWEVTPCKVGGMSEAARRFVTGQMEGENK